MHWATRQMTVHAVIFTCVLVYSRTPDSLKQSHCVIPVQSRIVQRRVLIWSACRHSGSSSQSRKRGRQPQDTAVSSHSDPPSRSNSKAVQRDAKRIRPAAAANSPQTDGECGVCVNAVAYGRHDSDAAVMSEEYMADPWQ